MSDVSFNPAGLAELTAQVTALMARTGVRIQRKAKQKCPVDTGRLRSSIDTALDVSEEGIAVLVGTNVEYAPYVEFGTRFMAPRPFLRSSVTEVLAEGLH